MGNIPLTKMKVLTNSNSEISSMSQLPPVSCLSYVLGKNTLNSFGGRDDRKLTVWELNQHRPYRIIQATYEGELKAMSARPDSRSIAVSDDSGEIKIFNFDDGKLIRLTNNGHACSVTAI